LPGNHDAWLGPFYERSLGARFVREGQIEREHAGLRLLATHGHTFGARTVWKHAMESRAFLHAFGALPRPIASGFDRLLDHSNAAEKSWRDAQYLDLFRRRAAELRDRYDLVVLGHIHQASDFSDMRPRVVVLGDWKRRASYLVVDDASARFVVKD
jgi:UDP-2,3-diacylglucosamine hydrolase